MLFAYSTGFFLMAAATPPLRGGEYDALKFRPNGYVIDIWLRLRRAMPFCGYYFFPPAGFLVR